MDESEPRGATAKEQRAARLAAVLARAVRDGELHAVDALRVLRHERRGLNTNRKLAMRPRSKAAQEVVERYEREGLTPPQNGSPDALHADHVWGIRETHLFELVSVEEWLTAMVRFREVVCLTATENYALEPVEKRGIDGWDKYPLVGIEWSED